MRCTIIDETDDWDTNELGIDPNIEKLSKNTDTKNHHYGVDYVYKLKICDKDVYPRVKKGHDYTVALSANGDQPVEFSDAKVSTAVRASSTVYFNLYDVANVSRVLSAVTDQSQ